MSLLDVAFYSFVVVALIQVVYYGVLFGSFSFKKKEPSKTQSVPISILICAKNEAENLKQFLPSIIEQDYYNFEIVLINDASTDKTLEVMEHYSEKHNNIKIVNVRNNETFWANKKYALTLGIKAAQHDHLLFTDADCKPVSKQWISEMASHFTNKKTIVLGYGAYHKIPKSFLNKLIRYETLLTAIQYFSFAKLNMPYMGVGRNLAYHRDEFYKTNGFIKHIKIRSGDDDLFINEAANSKNTTICYTETSFTSSIPKKSFKEWFRQKRRHVSTANNYKFKHKALLALFYISQILFWLLLIITFTLQIYWELAIAILVIRLLIQYLSIGFSAKKLNEIDVLYLLPLLEIFLIGFQLTIFITNIISKPKYWK
ncbi:cellulose synthase/poly-beta-1,6-N-acetylglucosamine synthase-like glycosyltransferase [Lacinutrix venerupis]|uniref:glycosyltransferase n=1 Tax=Lacinutrix venerupis TaxID=1486034 RepID=UPI000EB26807|nr:glycosyltransferase [Lacinutrix venerupis]RLJ61980.1 cellulose synthase/poly-beta-1,6-N-acetylglucosamine synthase-like glycosyltransferase [Lacinutrix venerupis]